MKLTKRELLYLGSGTLAAVALGVPFDEQAAAAKTDVDTIMKEFTAGKAPKDGAVDLQTPEIAENGNTVPISFDVESPMTADNYVTSVLLLADKKPRPYVATMHFSELSGNASATTRIRLMETQNVIAVAKMNNGDVYMSKKLVKVTIGGCGG